MSWHWHQCMSTYYQLFSVPPGREVEYMDVQTRRDISERLKTEVKLLLTANRKSYMPCRLAQKRMTLSDLEWPFHASRAISVVAELVQLVRIHTQMDWHDRNIIDVYIHLYSPWTVVKRQERQRENLSNRTVQTNINCNFTKKLLRLLGFSRLFSNLSTRLAQRLLGS